MLKFKKETEFKKTEIGEVPRDWGVEKISDVAHINEKLIKRGFPYPSIEYIDIDHVEEGIITKIREIELSKAPSRAKRIVKKGDILISTVRPNLRHYCYIKKAKDNTIASTGFAIITPKKINGRFLYYFITTDYYTELLTLIAESHTSAYPSFKPDVIEESYIPYPPLPEQSRIAAVLSWFDDLIENKKRQNGILEKTAMAIFKSWFVDFEPFKDGEFAYSEELGKKIPKGWEVKNIGEIADFTNGLSYKGREKFDKPIDDSYVFVTLNNIKEGGGFKTEFAWIKSNRVKERHFVKEGELIFANTEQTKSGRLLATPAFVVFPDAYNKSRGVYSHHITKVSLKDGDYKTYLYLTFRVYQKNIAQTYHTGTGVWGFDIKNFRENFLISIPPQPILQKFHSLVEPLFQKIILNQKEIMVLRKVRDALLPQLVFGKLRVVEL